MRLSAHRNGRLISTIPSPLWFRLFEHHSSRQPADARLNTDPARPLVYGPSAFCPARDDDHRSNERRFNSMKGEIVTIQAKLFFGFGSKRIFRRETSYATEPFGLRFSATGRRSSRGSIRESRGSAHWVC